MALVQLVRTTSRKMSDPPHPLDSVLRHVGDYHCRWELLVISCDQPGQGLFLAVAMGFDMDKIREQAGLIEEEHPVGFLAAITITNGTANRFFVPIRREAAVNRPFVPIRRDAATQGS